MALRNCITFRARPKGGGGRWSKGCCIEVSHMVSTRVVTRGSSCCWGMGRSRRCAARGSEELARRAYAGATGSFGLRAFEGRRPSKIARARCRFSLSLCCVDCVLSVHCRVAVRSSSCSVVRGVHMKDLSYMHRKVTALTSMNFIIRFRKIHEAMDPQCPCTMPCQAPAVDPPAHTPHSSRKTKSNLEPKYIRRSQHACDFGALPHLEQLVELRFSTHQPVKFCFEACSQP